MSVLFFLLYKTTKNNNPYFVQSGDFRKHFLNSKNIQYYLSTYKQKGNRRYKK